MWSGKPEMLEMFERWHFNSGAVKLTGAITMLSAMLILWPPTFIAGNFLMAAGILLIICLQLSVQSLKGAAIEVPFLLLNLLIIYLQHPLSKTTPS